MTFTPTRLNLARLVLAAVTAILAGDPTRAAEAEQEVVTQTELDLVKQAEAARIRAIESVFGSVVAMFGNNRQGGGSGVVVDPSGIALTNHHVVAAAGSQGWAGLADGKLYRWKFIGTDPGGDVAMIQLSGQDQFPVAPLGDSERVRVGDWAMAMGNPFVLAEDYRPTVTLGVVSGVKRYQYGSGKNVLVYGNCIQVDSSINPGNSGGPLFTVHGQLIGINGRASFKERGRVNVGLGYAISMKQIVNFIPDLLATKVTQHGTLDAQFGNRTNGVICQAINLDSPAAEAGLKLGDRLIEFEGEAIDNANQLTNLVSTLPAHWPATAVCERDGEPYSFTVRLTPLPYGQLSKAQPVPVPKPPPKKEGEKKDGEKKDIKVAPKPRLPLSEPGKIRDEKLNRENCLRIIRRWRTHAGVADVGDEVKAFRIHDTIFSTGQQVGSLQTLLATDGRFRVDVEYLDKNSVYAFDGKIYWAAPPDAPVAGAVDVDDIIDNPFAAQAAILATRFQSQPLAAYGEILLDGSDKAGGCPAYRVKATGDSGRELFAWLSVVDSAGQMQVRLLKTGRGIRGRRRAVTYGDWQQHGGVWLPGQRNVVERLAEDVVLQLVTTRCETVEDLADEALQIPTNENEK